MKLHHCNRRTAAFTLTELLVVIAVLAILAALVDWGVPASTKRRAKIIACMSNLKQIGIAYRIWEGDHGDKYPMFVSVTNNGAMELAATGNVAACFQMMSNELSTPKILVCYADTDRICAADFSALNKSNISYFVGLDADERKPQTILSGDDNFAIGGVPVSSGLLELSTNASITWAAGRHESPNVHFWTPARDRLIGNIGFADGHVNIVTSDGLNSALAGSGATKRLAIP
jgi:prepilin-type N-terminal cleavage/methylation domain-containing protein/prepilin-type processing-associated H-X9-DG protein